MEEFTGADDNEAIAEGQRLSAEHDYYPEFEIWEGARLITIGHRGDLVTSPPQMNRWAPGQPVSGERNIIQVRTIVLANPEDGPPREVETYSQADEVMQNFAVNLVPGRRLNVSVIVVFKVLFAWASSLSVSLEDATADHFVQRAIQADWEFSAGVRPAWWPNHHEAARTWDVHHRENREHEEGAEAARMRMVRYDLLPLVLSDLPPRTSFSEQPLPR